MKVGISVIVFFVLSSVAVLAQDIGLVVVAGEAPVPVQFTVSEFVRYKFDYESSCVALWDSATRDNPIPSGTVFQAGAAEPGCEVDLSDFAALQTCFSGDGGGLFPGCEAFDADMDNDVDLDDYGAFHGTFIGPVCNVVFVTVFVEGLVASADLGDVVITLLTDPEGDDTFAVRETQAVTVVSIVVSPTSVQLGTLVTITLAPAVAPLAFGGSTTATWSGDYVRAAGPPLPVTVAYDADEVLEASAGEARLIAGSGTFDAPLAAFLSVGTLHGVLSIQFSGVTVTKSQSLAVQETAGGLHRIAYGEDNVRSVGAPADSIFVHGAPIPTEEQMLWRVMHHYAAVVPVEKSPETIAGPTTLDVQVITLDATFSVIGDIFNLTLTRLPDDTDPNDLLYVSDLLRPLFPFNVAVDRGLYADVIPFQTIDNGVVIVVGGAVTP